MSRLLSLNLDFVLILQSGLLLLLATALWGLGRSENRQLWFWFGGYAFFQSLRTGLELVAFEQSAPPLHGLLRDVLLVLSSLSLIEFARSSYSRGVGRWIHGLIAGGMAAAQLIGGETDAAWAGFAVAMLASFWAMAAFWRGNNSTGPEARPLRQAGLIIIACQLLGALPDQFLASGTPVLPMALPLVVVRCALFFILTLTLLQHEIIRENNFLSDEQSSGRQRRRTVRGLVVMLIGLAG